MHGALTSATAAGDAAVDDLIRAHYRAFNERRIDEAAARFDPAACVESVTGRVECGPDGYRQFASRWLEAFPDAVLDAERIRHRAPGVYDVDLTATGTHTGTLRFESWIFRPTGFDVRLSVRELLQVDGGRFHFASLSFDLQDLVRQLAHVDTAKLLDHIARVQQLGEQLKAAADNRARQRELIDRLGSCLDAARHVVRPYFR